MLCWFIVICVPLFLLGRGGGGGRCFVNVLLLFNVRKEFGMS